MRKRINAVRVGSSDSNYYNELKKAHKEFERMLADGWQVTNVKKTRRPRIQRTPQPKYVVTLVFGRELKMTIEEYNTRGQGFKKIREIY